MQNLPFFFGLLHETVRIRLLSEHGYGLVRLGCICYLALEENLAWIGPFELGKLFCRCVLDGKFGWNEGDAKVGEWTNLLLGHLRVLLDQLTDLFALVDGEIDARRGPQRQHRFIILGCMRNLLVMLHLLSFDFAVSDLSQFDFAHPLHLLCILRFLVVGN